MGKGDTPRPVDKGKYDVNYERVFGKRPIKTWTDPPRLAEGGGTGSESDNELPKKPDGQPDP